MSVDGMRSERRPRLVLLDEVAQTAESVLQNAEFPGHKRMVARGLTELSRFCYDR